MTQQPSKHYDEYRTNDFYLASFLRAAGFPSDAPQFDAQRRATFIFHDVDADILVSYYNASETHRVSAIGLIRAIKETRETLYNFQQPQ